MPMLVGWDDREDYSEDRWIGIGLLRQYVAVVVYIEQEKDSIRIISLRKATSREHEKYEQTLRDRLGPDYRHEG